MSSRKDDLLTLRFSTAQFAEREAVEAFRETFGRTILRIEMEPVTGHALQADMTLRAFSGFGMATGLLSPMRNRHTAELIDNDDLVLVLIQSGSGTLEQHGRRVEVGPSQVIVTDNGVPGTFTAHTPVRATNLRLNRALIEPLVPDLGKALLSPILQDSPALRLLLSYAGALNEPMSLATPTLRRTVATHMHELAALALGATGDAARTAAAGGGRAARLRAIKADIIANIGDAGLSASTVAARHGITPRYVRMLFEAEDTSFSGFVTSLRLQRAHHLLSDPQHLDLTISAIAFECGFSDLSYFNRTFRRLYGSTPSDVRAQATRSQ